MRTPFRMPPLPEREWLDADGTPIIYGDRWGMDGPAEDAYSRITHPERCRPLHDVADALVAHLLAEYECLAADEEAHERELRAVRLHSAPGTADVRIAWTDFPGVQVRLGSGASTAAPGCGCDACDEGLEVSAEQLRDAVLAAVTGDLREGYSAERGTEGFGFLGHASWGKSSRSAAELQALAARTPERWAPWPVRAR